MMNTRQRIDELLPQLTEIRHDLHRHPELGYEEHRTCGIVKAFLDEAGITWKGDLAGGTGVLAHIPGDGDNTLGPIALRADMDALPIVEQSGVAWTSTHEGRMHACGHDGHTAILLGTARVLKDLSKAGELPRDVTLVFQPAEEGGAGGAAMVRDGCLDGSVIGEPITHIYGLHGWTSLALGQVASRSGPILASADGFEATITGRGGHAAMPHLCVDPIAAAAAVIQSAQHIVSRHIDPIQGGVVSITRVEGGTTHNIIPESVFLQGTTRFLDDETGIRIHDGFDRMLHQIAGAHGCQAQIHWHDGYPVTVNHPDAFQRWQHIARETLGGERVEDMAPVMGGEDFSFYGQVVPACFFAVGLLPDGQREMPCLHHPCFDFNDAAIPTGIEVFTALAVAP